MSNLINNVTVTEHKLPVTVLSGFLGAGKTTVLNSLLNNTDGMRIAVIVNDMSEINIDASLIRQNNIGPELIRSEEELVEMSNGCICCTLREDLLKEITRLALSKKFDYLVIESSGISEPLPVAQTFTFVSEEGESLSKISKLDTLVTVVDTNNFFLDLQSCDSLKDRGQVAGEDDNRELGTLLIDQIEFSNVILLTKQDLAGTQRTNEVKAFLKKLNPEAEIYDCIKGQFDPKIIINRGLFDMESSVTSQKWQDELQNEHKPETEEYGIKSFSFEANIPFHPERFSDFLFDETLWDGVLRSKGYFWLASRFDQALFWSQCGGSDSTDLAGLFWAAVDKAYWPQDPAYLKNIEKKWSEPYGDRRQELVFIGSEMDEDGIKAALQTCLLTEEELSKGKDYWKTFPDPFPQWEINNEIGEPAQVV